ncbi:MAG: SNF2 helicase associated domain-containing protein, partial [Deltaproteobacteria bacterium]|nr:SNF2 helicase associated domain-containing protein [Deltaproteobacteria bacterium]
PDLFKKLSKAVEASEPEGDFIHFDYQVAFHPKQEGMRLWVYQGDKLITRFEQYGIHALGLDQHGLPHSDLAPGHRRLAQNLLRFAKLYASEGYFWIPKKHVGFFIPKLARFPSVILEGSEETVIFSEHGLYPLINLMDQSPSLIRLSARFQDGETGEIYNFEQARLFGGRRVWAWMGAKVFEVKNQALASLLEDFNPMGLLELKGEEAADFIQDYLPLLSEKKGMELPKDFAMPEVIQEKAEALYEISEDEASDKLFLELKFRYGQHILPAHMSQEEAMAEVEVEGVKQLIRRDLAYERKLLAEFSEQGFQRVGPTSFETGGPTAFDFISQGILELGVEGQILGQEDLKRYQLLGTLGEDSLKAKAKATSMDWLELDLSFEVGGVEVPYETVQALIAKGEKYIQLEGQGFAKIDTQSFQALEEKFAELDAEIGADGKVKVSRYHGAYLEASFAIDWENNQEIGRMMRSIAAGSQVPEEELPPSLTNTLRDYQHHGFSWMRFLAAHAFHGILADDMGLGKTIQALSYLLKDQQERGSTPNLVLAPTSVVFNWAAEAEKFAPDLKVLVHTGAGRGKDLEDLKGYDLILSSYAIFRRDVDLLTGVNWRTVVLDEAQNIKNYRSKTAMMVKQLKAEHRWALSGTPMENHLSELWSIFDFLMPGFLGSYPHFKRKYQQPIEGHQSLSHLERLKKRIYPFILRRLKQDVAKELPPKTEITNLVEMTTEQQKLYQEVLSVCRKQVLNEVEKRGIDRSQVSILTALLRLRQVCCHPELLGPTFKKREAKSGKMEAFQDLLLEVIEEGHRVLVFSQFVEMLSLLRNWLDEKKITYEYLDGRTRRRDQKVKNFNENENIPVFLVSLKAGGTGLNLTGADYVIHYDPWWNPAVQDQATDRVHRIGQKKHVFSYKLITKDTVEEKILKLQERKRGLAEGILSKDSGLGKKLTVEDLEYLFN